jgi:uncharacterized repeat protein (TIGR03803 family)
LSDFLCGLVFRSLAPKFFDAIEARLLICKNPSKPYFMKRLNILFVVLVTLLSSSVLYAQEELWGMTPQGGDADLGVIFNMNTDGTGQTVVHEFSTPYSGGTPGNNDLTQHSSGKFYGMTHEGGKYGEVAGVLFEYDPATGIYVKRFDFNPLDGLQPRGKLVEAPNGKYYGITVRGGAYAKGVLFEFDPVSNVYTKKFDFDGTQSGAYPNGRLALAPNGKFYGLASEGGVSNGGVIFEYDPINNIFEKKHDFIINETGFTPTTHLILAANGKFYGTTSGWNSGNPSDVVIFEYDYLTGQYGKKCTIPSSDGKPLGSLMQASDGKLYGMTYNGGSNGGGVIFDFNIQTNVYTKRFEFAAADYSKTGVLTEGLNGNLYGLTAGGGSSDYGVLFEFNRSTGEYIERISFDGSWSMGGQPNGSLTLAANGKFYGLNGTWGTLFEFDPVANVYTSKFTFNSSTEGAYPQATLTRGANGKLYGLTVAGGTFNDGVLFEIDPMTKAYVTRYNFQALAGRIPQGTLTLDASGKFYGMTAFGGTNGKGVLFEFNPSTNSFVKIFDFDGTNGAFPYSKLTLGPTGKYYGMTSSGGTNNKGVIFEFDQVSGTVTRKVDLWEPHGALTLASNNKFYAMTSDAPNGDFIFEYDAVANIYVEKFQISSLGAYYPQGDLIPDQNGILWGLAYGGGANDAGIIFSYDLQTDTGVKRFDFTPETSGAHPYGSMLLGHNSKFYGMTREGGTNDKGVIFQFDPLTYNFTKILDFDAANGSNPLYNNFISVSTAKASQTITFTSLPAKKFGDATFELAATSSSGLPITYSSSNTLVAAISGNTVTIVGAGSSTITASQAGDNDFSPATDKQQIQVVTKGDQTITFDPLPAKNYGDAAFTLTGASSSTLALTYTSSNTAIATISGNTLTIVGVGTATITAKQAGDANYNAAANVPQTLIVAKGDQAITFNALPAKNFGDAAFTLGATASSGLTVTYGSSNPAVATISGKTVTIKGVGTTTITASQSGNTKYNAAPNQTQDLVVNKKSQTITFAALPAKTYGSVPFNLSATASSGLVVSYASSDPSVATVSGKTVTIVGAGICTIAASQSGNANYAAAPDVPRQLTVNKANQTVTLNAIPAKTYGDAPFTVSATSSTGLPVTYSSSKLSVATVSGNMVTIVGAGTAVITATQAGNSNYNAASNGKTLTVAKATQTISFGPLPGKNYGDAPFNLSATSSSGLPITYVSSVKTVATVTGNTVKIVGVGSTSITASQPGDLNYTAATSVSQPLVVSKGDPIITFDPLPDKNFGDPAFTLNATSTSNAAITFTSSDITIAKISTKTVTMLKPGTVIITASQPATTLWNSASKTQQLNVLKKSQTITFNALPVKTYGDPSFTVSATSTSGLPVSFASSDNTVATVSGNTITLTGPGIATITASQAGNATYAAAADVPQILTVKVAPPTDAASFIEFSNVTATSMTIECFPGNGNNRLFVIKPTSPTGFFSPVDNTTYNIGFVSSGSQVVSNNGNSIVSVAGLTPDTRYYVKVYEYNAQNVMSSYLVAGAPTASQKTTVGGPGRINAHSISSLDNEEAADFAVTVSANPFKETLVMFIRSSHEENAQVALMDMSGKLVHQSTEKTNTVIGIEKPFVNGVYFLKVRTKDNQKTLRVVRMD